MASPWYRTPEATERVAELTRQGLSAPVIAEMLGVSTRTVQRARQRAGVSQPASNPFSDDEKRRAQAMLDDGASMGEVARTLGRSRTPLLRCFGEYPRWTPAQIAEAAALGRAMARLERKAAK